MSKNKKEVTKLLSFMAMADGGIYYSKNHKNAKFIMNMRKANQDYVEYVASAIGEITTAYIYERKDYNVDGCVRQPQLRVESSAHPYFNTLHSRIYTDKYKGLDPHALKLLDPEALAILYMCDGSLFVDKVEGSKKRLVNDSYSVRLHLKRLCYGDQIMLKKALKDKLDQEWNVTRAGKYYELRLRNKDIPKFMDQVGPYVLPSFQYKLVRLAPEMGGDIVCSVEESTEASRNAEPVSSLT